LNKELTELRELWGCSTNWGIAIESLRRGYSRKFLEAHEFVLSNHRTNVYLNETERQFLQYRAYDLKFSDIAKIMKIDGDDVVVLHTQILGEFGIKNDMELLAIVLVNRLVVVPIELAV